MKIKQTAVTVQSNILEQLRQLVRQEKHGYFSTNHKAAFLKQLDEALSLNDTMSISDLACAISTVENLLIKPEGATAAIHFKDYLDSKQYRILDEAQSIPASSGKKLSIIVPGGDTEISSLLIKLHESLLSSYQLSRNHAAGQIPVSKVKYSTEQLQSTQSFFDLELTSQQAQLPDSATIVKDIQRKGVTLNGKVITAKDSNDNNDPWIRQAIENFTGDQIHTAGSQANKIYHFGGQFLEAILLQEFTHSMQLATNPDFILERGMVKGHIDWVKNPENGEISAKVNLKIFTCSTADLDDVEDPQKFFTIGSDGSSLVQVVNDDLEKVIPRASAEVSGKTKGNIVPVCELNGTVRMVFDQSQGACHLKVSEFTNKIYTPDLISDKALQFIPVEKAAPEAPVKVGTASLLASFGQFALPKASRIEEAPASDTPTFGSN
ncbi:hypothetical protein [Legionella quinlivanii]|uniref:hypothetical protein n=1 Tax=Legionella quinlivanii TaxID=45073 RepID=UPI002243791D|nr:hypothetical protein [Legionella quinlivanii]MCW8450202.1 hypothetical protein [Legionella quinlivanii]